MESKKASYSWIGGMSVLKLYIGINLKAKSRNMLQKGPGLCANVMTSPEASTGLYLASGSAATCTREHPLSAKPGWAYHPRLVSGWGSGVYSA